MRAEASANLKKLLEIEKRLFLSTEDLKIQHAKSVQVCKVGMMLFPSFFPNTFSLFSKTPKFRWQIGTEVCGEGVLMMSAVLEEEHLFFPNSAMWYCDKETAEDQTALWVGKRKEDAKNET